MADLSAHWPKTLFTLHGEGEENTDIWVNYYLRGLVHQAKTTISHEDFNPGKLAPPQTLH